MRRILIVGAGGHGQVVADILIAARSAGSADVPIGFLDDDPSRLGLSFDGLSVLGAIGDLSRIAHDGIVIGIGDNLTRSRLFEGLRGRGECLVGVVHPTAVIARSAELGAGVVVCAGVVINTATRIGPDAILNTGCTVDHHNAIGAHAHIAPGVHLGGTVTIGEGTFVGIGAVVIPERSVGPWAIVGAGTVVTRDIPGGVTAVGVPARILKSPSPDG